MSRSASLRRYSCGLTAAVTAGSFLALVGPSYAAADPAVSCPTAPPTSYSVGSGQQQSIDLPDSVDAFHFVADGGNGGSTASYAGGAGAEVSGVWYDVRSLQLYGGQDGTDAGGGESTSGYAGGAPGAGGAGGGSASGLYAYNLVGVEAAGGGGAGVGAPGGSAVASSSGPYATGGDGGDSASGKGGGGGSPNTPGADGDGTAHTADGTDGDNATAPGAGGGGGGYTGGGAGAVDAGGGAGATRDGHVPYVTGYTTVAPRAAGSTVGARIDFPVITQAPATAAFTLHQTGSFTICAANVASVTTSASWLSAHDNGDGTFTLSGAPTAGWTGSQPISVTATDADGGVASVNLTVNVAGLATPTVTDSAGNETLTYPGSATLQATVSDPDGDCTSDAQVQCTPSGSVTFTGTGADASYSCTAGLQPGESLNSSTTGCAVSGLIPGTHTYDVSYGGNDQYAPADGDPIVVTVARATPIMYLQTGKHQISARVLASSGGDGPTGSVTFYGNGRRLGTAPITSKGAVLKVSEPPSVRRFKAVYSGDSDYSPASVSIVRTNPKVTVTVKSTHKRSRYGWYRAPVTVTFVCANDNCQTTARLTRNTRGTRITRTLQEPDGAGATVTSPLIRIDRTAPTVYVYETKSGHVACSASDKLSGVAHLSCRHVRHGITTEWTARAVDRAGNVTVRRLDIEARRPGEAAQIRRGWRSCCYGGGITATTRPSTRRSTGSARGRSRRTSS